MAVMLKSTEALAADGVKMLVYGQAGSGKTSLIPTLPAPVFLMFFAMGENYSSMR